MTIELSARTLRQLQLMAIKLQNNPSYMAWIISIYQKQEKLPSNKLIEVLGTNEEMIARLALCKRPDTNSNEFRKQAIQISEYTKIEMLTLVKMIRQVESVITISSRVDINSDPIQNTAKLGFAAARDRNEENSADEKPSNGEGSDDVADQ